MKFLTPQQKSEFNQRVWQVVRQIPAGMVSTYGQIAKFLAPPTGVAISDYQAWGARWVGNAMAGCPDDVPWQRVINSKGEVSLRPGQGQQLQQALLEAEGIELDARKRVDLKHYLWDGPGAKSDDATGE